MNSHEAEIVLRNQQGLIDRMKAIETKAHEQAMKIAQLERANLQLDTYTKELTNEVALLKYKLEQ